MKRVAIISYNTHSMHMNYGAALHSFAFQQYLMQQGQNSTIIDYESISNKHIKWPFLFPYNRITNIHSFIKHVLQWGLGGANNYNKYIKFKSFFKKHCICTKKCYTKKDLIALSELEEQYDIFVCESDVIWKTYGASGFNDVFLLNIPCAKGKVKVAYSPSLGSKPFTPEQVNIFKTAVSDFSAISVREKQGAEYLSKILEKKVEWVLDPTLLLKADDYGKILREPKETGYLLVYNCMTDDTFMWKTAEKLGKEKGLKVIEISNFYHNKFRCNHSVFTNVGVEEWLGYFKNADYILCNAFHGLCFSVIFHKQFLIFERDASDYRMKNISTALGIEDHLIPWNNKKIPNTIVDIDYKNVDEKLYELRQKSYNFISENILKI